MENNPQQKVSGQAYLHTREAAAYVPLLQSVFTGFLLALLVFIGLLLARVFILDALLWALVAWVLVVAAVWIGLQFHWFSLTNLERLTGLDINRDGVIAAPPASPARETRRTVQVLDIREVTPNGHLKITTARFDAPEWKLVALAQGLLAGKPFAERQWTGENGPFSQSEFDRLRAEMLQRGLLRQKSVKSKTQGYELTPAGRAVMQDFASRSPTPPPTGEQNA